MPKDVGYHESAILYNKSVAEHAEQLAEEISHEEVAGWSRGLARFHRFHADRHQTALDRLNDPEYQEERKQKNREKNKRRKKAGRAHTDAMETHILVDEEVAQSSMVLTDEDVATLDAITEASQTDMGLSATGVGTVEEDVIEIAPGITRPMTEEEKASRQALLSNNQEAANG